MYLDLPSLLKVSDNVIIYDVKKRFIKTRLEYIWKLSITESTTKTKYFPLQWVHEKKLNKLEGESH